MKVQIYIKFYEWIILKDHNCQIVKIFKSVDFLPIRFSKDKFAIIIGKIYCHALRLIIKSSNHQIGYLIGYLTLKLYGPFNKFRASLYKLYKLINSSSNHKISIEITKLRTVTMIPDLKNSINVI